MKSLAVKAMATMTGTGIKMKMELVEEAFLMETETLEMVKEAMAKATVVRMVQD